MGEKRLWESHGIALLGGLLGDKVEWRGVLATSDELPLTDRIAYGTASCYCMVVGYRQHCPEPSLSEHTTSST
ncbi:hypothetical protein OK016_24640 [Vibrio chagasii]|nr:hypothetical protein [Vibrio chagasii]